MVIVFESPDLEEEEEEEEEEVGEDSSLLFTLAVLDSVAPFEEVKAGKAPATTTCCCCSRLFTST